MNSLGMYGPKARPGRTALTLLARGVLNLQGVRWNRVWAWAALLACLGLAVLHRPVQAQPDMNKVLRWHFEVAEIGFDPVRTSDFYSSSVMEPIFERLLTYDYLADPVKLVPQTAQSLPEVSPDGKTYTFKLQKGILFADDPAFGGKKRELTARDYVYSFMRHMDPKNRSPWAFMLEGKIVGLDDLTKQAAQSGRFNYDARVPGFEMPDPYTLRIRLNAPDYNFAMVMAHVPFGAVAREVVERYVDDLQAHPVGTGPYRLTEWKRRSKMVLEANPNYRGLVWNAEPGNDPVAQAIAARMKGKRLPLIGRVEIHVVEEEQAIWLAFQQKQLDMIKTPNAYITQVLDKNNAPTAQTQKASWQVTRVIEPEHTYTFMNMRDPIVGGFEPAKQALRRAIVMGFNTQEEVDVIRRGQAMASHMLIPPGVRGYDPNYRSSIPYDPDLANRLLDRFGYKKGAEGFRTQPNGQPLVLRYHTEPTAKSREHNELWRKSMNAIGLNIEFLPAPFGDNYKAAKQCKLMMWGGAWIADYPDGENFLQQLYGGNIGQSNNGCYASPAYDALYKQALKLPDGPERQALYVQMNRQFEADSPWRLGVTRTRTWVAQPHVIGFKKHPILHADWMYLDLKSEPKP